MGFMSKQKLNPHMLELAKRGAEAQVRDLMQEIKYLLDLFPHLRDAFDRDELPLRFLMERQSGYSAKAGAERRGRRAAKKAAKKS
jgi:hypothetical protein